MVGRIIRNVAWLLLERSGKILASVFIGGLVARQLGVAAYGNFQYALAVVLIFASLGLICGGEIVVPRLMQAPPESAPNLLGNAFVLRFISSMLAYCSMLGYMLNAQGVGEDTFLVGILGLMVFFREPFGVIIAWLQSRTHNKPGALVSLYAVLIKLLLVFVIYRLGIGSKTLFATLWLLEAILVAIGLLLIYHRHNGRFFFSWSLSGVLPLFKDGLPFWFALIAMYIFLRMDRLMLKTYCGLNELGMYSAVMQVSENVTMVASAIAATAAPLLIYHEQNFDKLRKNVYWLALGMFGIGILGAVVGTLLAPLIVKILFGDAFARAAPMLGYSLFAASVVFVDSALNTFLLKYSSGSHILYKWITVLIVGLIVDLWAIPKWGGYGALLGFSSGYIAAVALGSYWIATTQERTTV